MRPGWLADDAPRSVIPFTDVHETFPDVVNPQVCFCFPLTGQVQNQFDVIVNANEKAPVEGKMTTCHILEWNWTSIHIRLPVPGVLNESVSLVHLT